MPHGNACDITLKLSNKHDGPINNIFVSTNFLHLIKKKNVTETIYIVYAVYDKEIVTDKMYKN